VLLKIVYALTWRTLGLVVVLFRGDRAIAAEMLVLRHENAVLRRQAGRVRYEPADRAWFAALARIVSRRRWAEVFPVTPATLLAWHRRLAAKKYDTSGRRSPGRLQQPRVSSGWCCAWRGRIRYGAIAGSRACGVPEVCPACELQ
jgi:putative transposase